MMKDATQTTAVRVGEMALKTLETMESQPLVQATENCAASSYRDKMRLGQETFKRNWINKRLNLDHHHPELIHLEESVWSFCRGVAMNPKAGKRYVVFGNNGVGKSKSAKAIYRFMRDRALDLPLVDADYGLRTCDCLLVNWAETVDNFKAGDWSIDHLIEATVLVLDDIGAEHDPSKVGVEKLYLILERREHKWTWITTNIIGDAWEERFERRISDRLNRNSFLVDLTKVPSYSINT